MGDTQEKTPGQVAYEAYGDYQGWKTWTGDPMPTWEDRADDPVSQAWEAAAAAVVEMVEGRTTL